MSRAEQNAQPSFLGPSLDDSGLFVSKAKTGFGGGLVSRAYWALGKSWVSDLPLLPQSPHSHITRVVMCEGICYSLPQTDPYP